MTKPNRPTEESRKAAFGELIARLEAWQIPTEAVDSVHDLARASLVEVKALTEYEDGKVSRLLTIIAFLSAVVAAAFTRFSMMYPWPGGAAYENVLLLLPLAAYAAFFLYVLVVTWSVLRVLAGIRPTFNEPASWKNSSTVGLPGSMVFYARILDVPAPKWAEAFQQLTGSDGKGLKSYYAKCYIAEAYLVAEKVATKLKIVETGVTALRAAMWILFAFFILFAAAIVTAPVATSSI